uniref:Uncharacterized protein n=1 Tax=Rhizophora mucronata TaxID=61149 RepID=A0A2P2J504_RHIMU
MSNMFVATIVFSEDFFLRVHILLSIIQLVQLGQCEVANSEIDHSYDQHPKLRKKGTWTMTQMRQQKLGEGQQQDGDFEVKHKPQDFVNSTQGLCYQLCTM